ncbi:Hypothetical predicted protein, partial [Mytilus galloprovincialis]
NETETKQGKTKKEQMSVMPPKLYHGCGRGVFGLKQWDKPLRRPRVLIPDTQQGENIKSPDALKSPEIKCGDWANYADKTDEVNLIPNQNLVVKYSYKANADSPLGEPELTVTQKDTAVFISYHQYNNLWSKIRSSDGRVGYVPTSYVMAVEEEVTALPWLKKPEPVKQEEVQFKPYKSAYAKNGPAETDAEKEDNLKKYYCDVCQKQLNGPQPFIAHMNSKAHKEEVEAQQD